MVNGEIAAEWCEEEGKKSANPFKNKRIAFV
jgi:hypothetical protein